jgi:hypothetical protein
MHVTTDPEIPDRDWGSAQKKSCNPFRFPASDKLRVPLPSRRAVCVHLHRSCCVITSALSSLLPKRRADRSPSPSLPTAARPLSTLRCRRGHPLTLSSFIDSPLCYYHSHSLDIVEREVSDGGCSGRRESFGDGSAAVYGQNNG